MNKVILLPFIFTLLQGMLASAEIAKQRFSCVINSNEWCATIPNSALARVGSLRDICVFKFSMLVFEKTADIKFTIRTRDHRLNFQGNGPEFHMPLNLQSSQRTLPPYLRFGSSDQSFFIEVSDTQGLTQKMDRNMPIAYLRSRQTPADSYGNSFLCTEVNAEGKLIYKYR